MSLRAASLVGQEAHENVEIGRYCILMRDAMAEINKVDSETKAIRPFKDFLTEQQKKENERLLVKVKGLEEDGKKRKNRMDGQGGN